MTTTLLHFSPVTYMHINTFIPGTRDIPGRESLYVQITHGKGLAVYNDLSDWVLECNKNGSSPSSGAVIFDECEIVCPDHYRFTAFSFRGDLAGWRRVIESYCSARGLLLAVVNKDRIAIGSVTTWPLSECQVLHQE